MADFTIKQGDLEPAISAVLKDHDGDVVNLSAASGVTFQWRPVDGGALVSAAGTIASAANGRVQYDWASGDTDTVGTYKAEFVVDWGGSPTRYQTFPSSGFLYFRVEEDLD